MDNDEKFELDLIATMFRGIREYIGCSLIMDQVVDVHTARGDELEAAVDEAFETIIDSIRGNKTNANVPFTNEDAHAILDAVAKWRLRNPAGNPRPPSEPI